MIGRAVVLGDGQVVGQCVDVVRSGQGAEPSPAGPGYTRNGMISRATMFATLIIGLIAGPAVSL
jgi:hypothetical protein